MDLCPAVLVLFLLQLNTQKTFQRFDRPSSVLSNSSLCDECTAGVLLQSGAQHVYLVCGPNSTYCPSNMMKHMPELSWTLFSTENATCFNNADRRHFCVVALGGDGIPDDVVLKNKMRTCYKTNMIVAFSAGSSPGKAQLETLFTIAWRNGIVDIVAVVEGLQCHVYTYVPFRKGGFCHDTQPILVDSWAKNSTCALSKGSLYFPENKISRLHLCELPFTFGKEGFSYVFYWYQVIHLLSVAMDATKVFSEASSALPLDAEECSGLSHSVGVSNKPLPVVQARSHVMPSYVHKVEYVFAVPRLPIGSILWSRLFNELSYFVWVGVAISILVSTVFLYVFMKGDKDFVFVVLFALQPLFGVSWSGNFLSVPTRLYFVSWLLFCFVISSAYMGSLLSELTAHSNDNAIKTLKDLLKSDLQIATISFGKGDFGDFLSSHPYGDALRKNIKSYDVTTLRKKINANRGDSAFFVSKGDFEPTFGNTSYRRLPYSVELVKAPFVMCAHSPLERLFQISFLRILSAGALDFNDRSFRKTPFFRRRRHVNIETNGPLSVSSFEALFVIWSIGCGVSGFVFLIEYFWYHKFLVTMT